MGKTTLIIKHDPLSYQTKTLLIFCFFLMIMVSTSTATLANNEDIIPEGIMTVDIPYNLFMALVLYHELSETEQAKATPNQFNHKLNQEIILAIHDVLDELRTEKIKYQILLEQYPNRTQIQQLLSRIEQTHATFNKELLFRQKVAEFLNLQQQQQQVIGD